MILASAPSKFDISKDDIIHFMDARDQQHRRERELADEAHRAELLRIEEQHKEDRRKLEEQFKSLQEKIDASHKETVVHLKSELMEMKVGLEGHNGLGGSHAPKRWLGVEGIEGQEVVAWDFQPRSKADMDAFQALLKERNLALQLAEDAKALAEAATQRAIDCEAARNKMEEQMRSAEREREVAIHARLTALEQLEKAKKEAKFLRERFASLATSVGSPSGSGSSQQQSAGGSGGSGVVFLGTPGPKVVGGGSRSETPIRFEYPGRNQSQKVTPTV
jgi:hypothetical protein